MNDWSDKDKALVRIKGGGGGGGASSGAGYGVGSISDLSPGPIVPNVPWEYARMIDYVRAQGVHIHGGEEHTHSPTLLQQLAVRLRLPDASRMPFRFVNAHRVNDDRVIVFLVTENHAGVVTPLVIEDDGNLYPSDALVTQLRLLIEK